MMEGWGWWGPGGLFIVLCMVAMVWMMVGHGHGHGHGLGHGHGHAASTGASHRPEDAERILAERLARGEIDVDEYERRLAALRRMIDLRRARDAGS